MSNEPQKNNDEVSGNAEHLKAKHHAKHPLTERHREDPEPEDTDKYLALEQPGVAYTDEADTTRNSDQLDYNNPGQSDEWSEEGGNSKNSDAFNQDDYILDDNIDLDEDENQSISSDDEDFEQSNERYTNEA